jgi:hypothetical protein
MSGDEDSESMPEPGSLKVGDLVRFVALPDEWSQGGFSPVPPESLAFMKRLIRRTWPSRVYEIDEYGRPWIRARIRERGKMREHIWAIMESTGWRRVNRRS